MAECSNCNNLAKENKSLRKAITDTNKQYVEVVNEGLLLRRQIKFLQDERTTWNHQWIKELTDP